MRPRERRKSLQATRSSPIPEPTTTCLALALPKNPRREEPGAIQKRAVVMVANEVPSLRCLVAALRWPEERPDFHRIRRVVEVDDKHVKDEHSRARDLVS